MPQLVPVGSERNDCVQTPTDVAMAIVSHFNPKGSILEPCCGDGNFLASGVYTSFYDIKRGHDFLLEKNHFDWIITNPPYSKFRPFLKKSMEVADNIVFLTSINHIWLKARIRDILTSGYGIKEIMLCDTPITFPPSGFQIGCVYLQKGYSGDIRFTTLKIG